MSGEGFFSRWSRQKAAAPAAATVAEVTQAENKNTSPGAVVEAKVPESVRQTDTLSTSPQTTAPPLPAIDSLNVASDYTPFMARDVAPELRNQAMKKLFTDPHYNIMDGLDTYIDDYGKPDPLPEGWLQLMNQSKTLRLFETEPEAETQAVAAPPLPTPPDSAETAAVQQAAPVASEAAAADELASVAVVPVTPSAAPTKI